MQALRRALDDLHGQRLLGLCMHVCVRVCGAGIKDEAVHVPLERPWRLPGELAERTGEGLRAVVAHLQRHLRDALPALLQQPRG